MTRWKLGGHHITVVFRTEEAEIRYLDRLMCVRPMLGLVMDAVPRSARRRFRKHRNPRPRR